MTLISFFTLFLFIKVLPFSIVRINGAILWFGEGTGYVLLAGFFILIGISIIIMAGIDLLKFRNYIIFPYLAIVLYGFDLYMIVFPNYFQSLFFFVPNAITDTIMIILLVVATVLKRSIIKRTKKEFKN